MDDAFAEIGAELRALRREDPASVVFYASGRASLETSYLYQLLARLYGNNNLPDSSNMCHETTSVALPENIGVPVGTVRLDDFEHCDAIFIFGHNTGVSSPRMLHQLQEARQRGARIVTFNPLREPGLVHFANPQSPVQMLTPAEIDSIADYVLSLSDPGADATRASMPGAALFETNCSACHGVTGEGGRDFGAPRLNDAIWLYGGSKDAIKRQITRPRMGVMPAFATKLDPETLRMLAVYVHSLGGGER